MNIFKKLGISALIVLTGLFLLPGKVWAADPAVTLSVNSSTGVISYNATDCDGFDLTLSVTLGSGSPVTKTPITISGASASDNITADMSAALSYLGANSVTEKTAFTISGVVDTKDGAITPPSVAPFNGFVYAGKVSAAEGSTKLTISDTSVKRTLNENETYGVNVTSITSNGAYFISSKTVGSGSPVSVNAINTTIDNKISEGNVVLGQAMAAIFLDPEPSTVVSPGYTGSVTVVPDNSPYFVSNAIVKNLKITSSTGSISKAAASLGTGDELDIEVAGADGTKATATLEITMADSDTKSIKFPKDFPFSISIEKPKPTSVEVSGTSVVYVGDGAETYTYSTDPTEFEDPTEYPVTWSAKGNPSTAASAKKLADGSLELTPKGNGTVTITATVGGVTSEPFVITILKEPENVTDVIVDGPLQITVGKGSTATYTAAVYLDSGKKATNQKVSWEVDDDTLAKISSTGVLTLTDLASVGDTINIIATSLEDDTVFSNPYEVEVKDIVTADYLILNTNDITKGKTIDMSVGKNVKTDPSGAANNIKSITWAPGDGGGIVEITGNGSKSVSFKGKKGGIVTLTPTVTYNNGSTETLTPEEFTVRDDLISEAKFGSDDKLTFTLPDTAYTSHDPSKNIDQVTGYQIDVMKKDGTVLYTVTKSGTDTISIDGETIEDYIEKAGESGKISGDSEEVVIRVSPRGKSQKDGKTTVTNTDAGTTTDTRKIYKVSIPETNTNYGGFTYGLPNHEVTVTAQGKNGGSTITKKYTVSTTTSNNVHKEATGSSNSGNGTNGGTNGSTGKNGTNGNYDKVPKTGESMAIYWVIMVAVISGCIAASVLYKYFTPKARKWKGGDTEGNDSYRKK